MAPKDAGGILPEGRTFNSCVNLDIMAEVVINQQKFQLSEHGTLADVLPLLRIAQPEGIAIAVNEEVVPAREWARYVLREGDRVFVIRATQGG